MQCADGRSFLAISKPLAHGGWVATMEDITERRKLEQERDRNQAFLSEIIDHIPSQITVKGVHDRRYLLVNRVAEAQFGISRDLIVGKTAFDLFPKASAEIILADEEKALQSPDGLFKDEHVWESQAKGKSYITSKRLVIRDAAGEPSYIVNVVDDVTERRNANEKIAHLAHYDALTDLPNRVLFREQIERELQNAIRGEQFALLYIDIDEFKGINDSLGHHVGDELLKAVAARIRSCIKPTDLIARLGGDEFAVIQTAVGDRAEVVEFVTRIHDAIRQPYQCLGHHLSTDASIGIALAPQDGTELDQLIKNADLAMYGAKAEGRRTHRFFEPDMDARAKARLTMEQDLRQAMVDGGFEIHYQPLVDLASNEVTRLRSAAALAASRTRHGVAGGIHPAGRGHRPDQRTRRLGDADRLRRGGRMAVACPAGRQRLADPVEIADTGAADHRRARRLRPVAGPAGDRNHRGGADPRRRDRARDPASAPRHRRAHRARRFRHRVLVPELSEAVPVRQDQDRPLLRQRYRGRRFGGDRAGGGEHRRLPQHDHDRRRRRNRSPARDVAQARLHPDAGLSVQQAAAGQRDTSAARRRQRKRARFGADARNSIVAGATPPTGCGCSPQVSA